MRLRVECYAGHRGEETPRALAIGGRRIEIIEILDRCHVPPDQRVRPDHPVGRRFDPSSCCAP